MNDQKLNHKFFFSKVKEKISDQRFRTSIEIAYSLAKEFHRGQFRDGGERYFEHVRAVAWVILTETTIIDQLRLTILITSALLHDMMEDTYMNKKAHLSFIFDQICPDIAKIIQELTKPPKDRYQNPWKRLQRSSRIPTKLIKAADRLHNLRTLGSCSPEKIARKVIETETVIIPWLKSNSPIHDRDNQDIVHLTNEIEKEIQLLKQKYSLI